MGDGGADLAARTGAHTEDRLDAVVDERRRAAPLQPAVGAQRHDHDVLAGAAPLVDLGGGAHRARGRVDDRRVPSHALPHRRTRTNDDEVGRLQAGQPVVKVGEARRHAGDGVAPVEQRLEVVERLGQQVAQRAHGVGDPALGDAEDQRLGPVDRGVTSSGSS